MATRSATRAKISKSALNEDASRAKDGKESATSKTEDILNSWEETRISSYDPWDMVSMPDPVSPDDPFADLEYCNAPYMRTTCGYFGCRSKSFVFECDNKSLTVVLGV